MCNETRLPWIPGLYSLRAVTNHPWNIFTLLEIRGCYGEVCQVKISLEKWQPHLPQILLLYIHDKPWLPVFNFSNCLSVFHHLVRLALKGLKSDRITMRMPIELFFHDGSWLTVDCLLFHKGLCSLTKNLGNVVD